MNIRVTVFDNINNKLFDASEAVSDIAITTQLFDNPGKCTFNVRRGGGMMFWEGATVTVEFNGVKMFKGFVFRKDRDKDIDNIQVTAYDQLRYLKNKDSKVFNNKTCDEIFSEICSEFVLTHKVVDKSSHKCTPRINDNTTLYQMQKTAFDDTLIHTKEFFIIRDNFGMLEHINIKSMKTNIIIGDSGGLLNFAYGTSIDEDTYNQIKLYRDNTETGKRELFIVNDSINGGNTLKRWGILQLYEKVDEAMSLPQIEQKARGMLSLYNTPRKSFRLECLGIPEICAGSSFICRIADLGDLSLDTTLLVKACTHKIDANSHTMSLDTDIISDTSTNVDVSDYYSFLYLQKDIPDSVDNSDSFTNPSEMTLSKQLKWPVPGRTNLSSKYGKRYNPMNKKYEMHTGVDIPAPQGTSIIAAQGGTITSAKFGSSYGNNVIISHKDGLSTLYAHCSKLLVKSGQSVSSGQAIALVGSTGMSTGPHLHFEIRKDNAHTNPMNYY